ncbi:putative exported protein [Halobacteriovorax marinus SJ]|uniref:Exported protein n=1 Tax=Halobacteriovorax marinus (strain ATCC BAA-682 / DSM 15412 / SJ) TaxID=862908 RepID=E1X495_HALMS|nr:hypothetical protein [Halobacteriovorax marinus]CBW27067.1 putative exported protein [Halobacteriovorax marinus SJ]
MKKLILITSLLVTASSFAELGVVSGNSRMSHTDNGLNFSSRGQSSGTYFYKQAIKSALPDAEEVLAGGVASDLFIEVVEAIETQKKVKFESLEEAAIAIIEEAGK